MENYIEFLDLAKKVKPDICKLLDEHIKVISSFSNSRNIESIESSKTYGHKVILSTKKDYMIYWDIEKLEKDIESKKFECFLKKFDIKTLLPSLQGTEIHTNYLSKAEENTKPIIIAILPFLYATPNIVIDGNHRVVSRVDKASQILGYQLPPRVHINYMADGLSRAIYISHYNLNEIVNNPGNPDIIEF